MGLGPAEWLLLSFLQQRQHPLPDPSLPPDQLRVNHHPPALLPDAYDYHVWISSQVAIGGDVQVGSGCFIGMHATIGHGISVGEKNFIGAGTLITKSTKPGGVFVQPNSKSLPMSSDDFAKII